MGRRRAQGVPRTHAAAGGWRFTAASAQRGGAGLILETRLAACDPWCPGGPEGNETS